MKISQTNTFMYKQEYSVNVKLGNLTTEELSSLNILLGTYYSYVVENTLKTKDFIEQAVSLSDFSISTSYKETTNYEDYKKPYSVLNFYISFINDGNLDNINNILNVLSNYLDFNGVSLENEDVQNGVKLIKMYSQFSTPEKDIENEIDRALYHNNCEEYFRKGKSIKLVDKIRNGMSEEDIVNLFNESCRKINQNIIDVEVVANSDNPKNDEILEIINNKLVKNEELKNSLPYKYHYEIGKIKDEYKLTKATNNSYVFYDVEQCNSLLEHNITLAYFNEVIYTYYLEVIRLKENLIYSPKISSSIFSSYTKHEVIPENLNRILELENEFFKNVNKTFDQKAFEKVKNKLLDQVFDLYEANNVLGLLDLCNKYDAKVTSIDIDTLFTLLTNLFEKLDSSYVILENFKVIAKTKVVGE